MLILTSSDLLWGRDVVDAWDLWHNWKIEECTRTTNPSSEKLNEPRDSRHDYILNPRCGLTQMPPELLNIISSYLDPESEVSFRLPCRTLYSNCGRDTVFGLRYKMRIDTNPAVRRAWRHIPEWFPGYSHIPPRLLWCSECKTRHRRYLFSSEEIARLPTRRQCLGRSLSLHVSPDCKLKFTDLRLASHGKEASVPINYHYGVQSRDGGVDSPDSARCSFDGSPQTGDGVPHLLSTMRQSESFLQLWYVLSDAEELNLPWYSRHNSSLFVLRYVWCFCITESSFAIIAQLSSPCIRFCPHLKSDDQSIAPTISEYLSQPISSKLKAPHVNCASCNTFLKISRPFDKSSIFIEVTRKLGALRSAGEEQWLAHLE